MRSVRLASLPLFLVAGACAGNVVVGNQSSLPTARLVCPERAQAGVPFLVDGSGSVPGALPFASVALSVVPGDDASDQLKAELVVPHAAVATARLVVTDEAGNVAEARSGDVVDDKYPYDGEGIEAWVKRTFGHTAPECTSAVFATTMGRCPAREGGKGTSPASGTRSSPR
jgi:hypothetical protein